jgi:hypothetical protein
MESSEIPKRATRSVTIALLGITLVGLAFLGSAAIFNIMQMPTRFTDAVRRTHTTGLIDFDHHALLDVAFIVIGAASIALFMAVRRWMLDPVSDDRVAEPEGSRMFRSIPYLLVSAVVIAAGAEAVIGFSSLDDPGYPVLALLSVPFGFVALAPVMYALAALPRRPW